jgi:hypothetical protein
LLFNSDRRYVLDASVVAQISAQGSLSHTTYLFAGKATRNKGKQHLKDPYLQQCEKQQLVSRDKRAAAN